MNIRRFALMSSVILCGMWQSCSDCRSSMHFRIPPYCVWAEQGADSTMKIRLSVDGYETDCMEMRHPIYRLEGADLNGDGIPEICIGVENSTRYWRQKARRIHIYQLYHGRYIRPLWLGSRVGHTLLDFEICTDSMPARIHTYETDRQGNGIESVYRLCGFGLQFERYIVPPKQNRKI